MADVDWLTKAACRDYDPEWWTLAGRWDPTGMANNSRAQQICRRCPVIDHCAQRATRLDYTGFVMAGVPQRRGKQSFKSASKVGLQCARATCRRAFTAQNARQRYCQDRCRSLDHSGRGERRG